MFFYATVSKMYWKRTIVAFKIRENKFPALGFRVNSNNLRGGWTKNDPNLAKYQPILIKFVSNDREDDGQIQGLSAIKWCQLLSLLLLLISFLMLVVVIKLLISSPRDFTCPQSCPTRQVDLRMMIILWQPKSELVVGHHRTLSYHFDNMWKDINYQMSFVILFSGLGFKRWVTEKSHFENNLEKCKDSCGFSTDSINDYILKQKMFVISLFSPWQCPCEDFKRTVKSSALSETEQYVHENFQTSGNSARACMTLTLNDIPYGWVDVIN